MQRGTVRMRRRMWQAMTAAKGSREGQRRRYAQAGVRTRLTVGSEQSELDELDEELSSRLGHDSSISEGSVVPTK
jgi:hypothetical protein